MSKNHEFCFKNEELCILNEEFCIQNAECLQLPGRFVTDATNSTWDFDQFVPDLILINLGTNDFGHDSGPAWEANFSKTYTEWVLNATRIYKNP